MNATTSTDEMIKRFRLASRELFNNFFKVPNPYKNDDAWMLEERFAEVEIVLFEKLVAEPASLSLTRYGSVQREILVELSTSHFAPISINHEIDSGYWDHPIKEVTKEARLLFIKFFDWDQLEYRDNRYVRVLIDQWSSHPEAVGKHALIESQYVRFSRA